MSGVGGSVRIHSTRMAVQTRLDELASLERVVSARLGGPERAELAYAELHPKAEVLVRLAALIAVGASRRCYCHVIRTALASGATAEDVLRTMNTVAPIVGVSRLVAATPSIALGLGYDIERALEERDLPTSDSPPARLSR